MMREILCKKIYMIYCIYKIIYIMVFTELYFSMRKTDCIINRKAANIYIFKINPCMRERKREKEKFQRGRLGKWYEQEIRNW